MSPLQNTRPRWRKVLSDLWENRARTALVVASIAVGVFAIGMIITTYFIISEDMDFTYATANPANIEIQTDFYEEAFLGTIERIEGVAIAEGYHNGGARVSADNGATWQNTCIIGIDNWSPDRMFIPLSIEGAVTVNEREMLLENRLAKTIEAGAGDTLLIRLADGTIREMPVMGVVQDQGVQEEGQIPTVAYVDFDTLPWLDRPQRLNRIRVRVTGDTTDTAHIEAVTDRVEEKIKDSGREVYTTTTNRTDEHPFRETVLAILGVLGAMGALMLILGGSLISNTLNALLNQHMRQIGVMKLVGGRSFQIFAMYLVLIITFGLIALLISIPLSGIAGYNFAIFLADLMEINVQEYRFIPQSVTAQVVIAIFVPLIAGILPVRSGSRTTVQKAISENSGSEGSAQGGWLELLGESAEWISRPLILSIRNTFRKKKRLALTLFTLTMAGAIFIAVFNVQASLNGFVNGIAKLFIADLIVDLDQPYRQQRFEQAIANIDGIDYIEGWSGGLGTIELANGDEVSLTMAAPPAASELAAPELLLGRQMRAGDERVLVVADTIYAEIPDLQIGDMLPISFNDGRTQDWEVIGIFGFPGQNAEFIFTYAPYEGVAPEVSMASGVSASYRVVTLDHSAAAQERIGKQVDQQLREAGYKVRNVEGSRKTLDDISEQIGILISFFLGMAILTAVVGSIGLAGTMSMNVLERTREIGVMRAIGAVDSAIVQSVIVEGMFIGVISWAIGSILSFPISYGLLFLVSTSISNSPMPLIFSVQGFWLWLIVVLVLAALASILPARNAARLTIREVLAYE